VAFEHGKSGFFQLDNNAGTLTDLTGFINNVDFPRDVDTPESTVFGVDDRTYIAGLRGATISISGFWDGASSQVDEVIEGVIAGANAATSKTFEYGPGGGVTGDVRYTGECFPTSYAVSHPVDGIVSFTLDLQITGAVTRNTF
jgi:hypothetical protein